MWYAGVVESLFEATATGRAMAKGRSLSQFQETCSATIWMESSDNQDGHFGGRGEVMIVAARR